MTGRHIAQVVFRLNGRVVTQNRRLPQQARLHLRPGRHTLTVRIIFTTGRHPVVLRRDFTIDRPGRGTQEQSPSRSPKTPGGFTG